jgi:uncharacterized flavoprotein (TIGR03862 family)
LRRLGSLGVDVRLRHRWMGWSEDGRLLFDSPAGAVTVAADATILALGGASWLRLGSDGGWTDILAKEGIAVAPLQPANCGFIVAWSEKFRERFEGSPLKRIALSFGEATVRGEAIVTRNGLEGGAVYALSGTLRDAIAASGEAILQIDLQPDLAAEILAKALSAPRAKQSLSTFLRKAAGLSPVSIGLLRESAQPTGDLAAMPAEKLAALIKALPIRLSGTAPIARAISSAGGISFSAIDEHFMLRKRPGIFVAGEMLDWEAPTGGYLLQACFSTGAAAACGALAWLAR